MGQPPIKWPSLSGVREATRQTLLLSLKTWNILWGTLGQMINALQSWQDLCKVLYLNFQNMVLSFLIRFWSRALVKFDCILLCRDWVSYLEITEVWKKYKYSCNFKLVPVSMIGQQLEYNSQGFALKVKNQRFFCFWPKIHIAFIVNGQNNI